MIFDPERQYSSYSKASLFLGEPLGLHDTIHTPYPIFEKYFQQMRKDGWAEWEVPMSPAVISDFAALPKDTQNIMFATIAWQWEADSVASRGILQVFAPFITNSELYRVWAEITNNEVTHAATYSHIVKSMFDDYEGALKRILDIKQNFARLNTVLEVLEDLQKAGCRYTLGMVPNNNILYRKVLKGVIALFLMERIQFMSSFAITNVVCSNGRLQPPKLLVQKIASDELNIHVQVDKAVIDIERRTERGANVYTDLFSEIEELFQEVVNAELANANFLFANTETGIAGLSLEKLKQWVLFCAKDAHSFLRLTSEWNFPVENPLPDMDMFTQVGMIDSAPQEIATPVYRLNTIAPGDLTKQWEILE